MRNTTPSALDNNSTQLKTFNQRERTNRVENPLNGSKLLRNLGEMAENHDHINGQVNGGCGVSPAEVKHSPTSANVCCKQAKRQHGMVRIYVITESEYCLYFRLHFLLKNL